MVRGLRVHRRAGPRSHPCGVGEWFRCPRHPPLGPRPPSPARSPRSLRLRSFAFSRCHSRDPSRSFSGRLCSLGNTCASASCLSTLAPVFVTAHSFTSFCSGEEGDGLAVPLSLCSPAQARAVSPWAARRGRGHRAAGGEKLAASALCSPPGERHPRPPRAFPISPPRPSPLTLWALPLVPLFLRAPRSRAFFPPLPVSSFQTLLRSPRPTCVLCSARLRCQPLSPSPSGPLWLCGTRPGGRDRVRAGLTKVGTHVGRRGLQSGPGRPAEDGHGSGCYSPGLLLPLRLVPTFANTPVVHHVSCRVTSVSPNNTGVLVSVSHQDPAWGRGAPSWRAVCGIPAGSRGSRDTVI